MKESNKVKIGNEDRRKIFFLTEIKHVQKKYFSPVFIATLIFFVFLCIAYSTLLLAQPGPGPSPWPSSKDKFLTWVESQIEETKKSETDTTKLEVRLRPFEHAKTFLNGPQDPPSEKKITVEPIGDFIYTEIEEPFEGSYKKAVDLYWAITTGKQKPSLFIESGAGRDEKITHLHSVEEGVEFMSDRVYQSSLAFNSRTTIHLRRFEVPSKHVIIIVNEVVKDWGAEMAQKKVKRMAKSYYPIFCDLNIDVYQETESNKFWYHSYALYRGQGMKSTNTSLNVAKQVGDIFSLGMLDKGLKTKLTSEAIKIWEKRRQVLQDLLNSKAKILSKDLRKVKN